MVKRIFCSIGILCCLIVPGTGLLSNSACAEIDVSWGAPVLAEDCVGIAYQPDMAVDWAGNAIVVWSQDDAPFGDNFNNIWTSRYTAGVGWGQAILLEDDDSGDTYSPRIALGDDGNGVAVWCQSSYGDGPDFSLWSSRFAVDSGWGQPELIENLYGTVYWPKLACNGHGDAADE